MDDRVILEKMAASVLDQLFTCLDAKEYTIVDRWKNRVFLSENGFTLEDQIDILHSLTPEDCIKAEPDRDDSSHRDVYWFYKKGYDGLRVYVKYKIIIKTKPDGETEHALIKSIHEDGR